MKQENLLIKMMLVRSFRAVCCHNCERDQQTHYLFMHLNYCFQFYVLFRPKTISVCLTFELNP